MERLKNHTFTSDKLTDEIWAKMDKLKINKSQVIRNAIKKYYREEIYPLELRLNHIAKRGNCPF
jgi:hypothetical protein